MPGAARSLPLSVGLLASLACGIAGTPERDKAWDALIAEAKKHGGVETKLDQSASYVFKRPDGSFITFTHLLKGDKRAACLVAKEQNATVCIDWDSGKTTYGGRKDAASPWVNRAAPDEADVEKPGLLQSLLSGFGSILGMTPFKCCDRFGNLTFTQPK
jgi:hypothetical protein